MVVGYLVHICHVLERPELCKSVLVFFPKLFALGKGDDKLKIHRASYTCTREIKSTEVSCNDQQLKE